MKLATCKDRADALKQLHERLLEINKKEKLLVEDARSIALINCSDLCQGAGISQDILGNLENGKISVTDFCNITGIVPNYLDEAIKLWDKQNRNGFITLYLFQIENMLHNLREQLQLPVRRDGIGEAIKILCTRYGISNESDYLYLPWLIRNSLHRNGKHCKDDKKIFVGGKLFEFKKDFAVTHGSWGDIIRALNASITVIEKILAHPEIRSLPKPIIDTGAWDIVTAPYSPHLKSLRS